MIVYRSAGIRIAELWYDERAPGVNVDIVRHRQALAPPHGSACKPFHTLVLDLQPSEDELFARFDRSVRQSLRHAERDGIVCAVCDAADRERLERFRAVYDRFAAERELAPLAWRNVERLVAGGQLELSVATVPGVDEPVVYHAELVVGSRVRLHYSVSPPVGQDELRTAAGRANRALVWFGIRRFKARGLRTYDFGGWYEGTDDAKKLQINRFKEAFGGRIEVDYDAERLVSGRARIAVAVARLIGRRA